MAKRQVTVDNFSELIENDGSGVGNIKARILNKELFKFHASDFNWQGGNLTFAPGVAQSKSPGWSVVIQGSVASGSGSFVSLKTFVNASVIGIRLRDNSATYDVLGFPDATIVVDGVPYSLWDTIKINTGYAPQETVFFIPEILNDGLHTVELVLHSLPTQNHAIVCFGFVLDKNPLQLNLNRRNDAILNTGTLTVTDTAVPIIINSASKSLVNVFRLKKVIYYNNDTSARVVTTSYNGTVLFQKSIPAKSTENLDFTNMGIGFRDTTDIAFLTHKAEVASLVTFLTIGDIE